MRSQFKYYTIILLSLLIKTANAQFDEKDYTLYSVKDGLSDNQVTCLQQDDRGYLWIGTKSGLNRFDGVNFRKYFQGNKPISLPSGFITQLKFFGNHQLGIFTRSGFLIVNTENYAVTDYIIPDTTAFSKPLNAAWDAVQLDDGAFALTTATGFYVLNRGGVIYRHDAFKIQDIPRKQILFGREIFKVDKESFLVYTNEDGQSIYRTRTKSFEPLSREDFQFAAFMHPRNFPGDRWLVKKQLKNGASLFISIGADSIIYYDHARRMRIASHLPPSFSRNLTWESQFEMMGDTTILLNSGYKGFFKLILDPKTGIIKTNETKFLINYRIKCLYVDKQNRLWVGTTQGILKPESRKSPIKSFQYPSTPNEFSDDFFMCAYRYGNMLYAGNFSRHHGLSIIDLSTMERLKQVQFYSSDSPWNEVLTMEMYHRDTLWIGTFAGILWYDIKSGHYGKVFDENKYPWATNFHAVLAPPRKDGYAWICNRLGGKVIRYHIPTRSVTLFSPQTSPALPFEKVKNIIYDSYGDVWISGHALTRWNNKIQKFDTVINVYAGSNKFNDDILSSTADAEGSLWLHNADNGLLQYKIKEKKFVAFTMKDGLPSSNLPTLSTVTDHQLWMASNSQLCVMDTRSKQFTVYDHSDGFPEASPTGRRMYYDSVGKQQYLFCEDAIVRFANTSDEKHSQVAEFILEDITVNNDSTIFNLSDKIELSHRENNLTLHFTMIDFDRDGYQFAYRLNNAASWNFIGSQHNISFSNLSPGKYLVELMATGKTGTNKTRLITINIKPPFWARTWFIVLVSLFIIGLLILSFRLRLQRVRQKANVDRLLAKTEMKALQAQMNPHFVFNSLNSIREMILHDQNKEASHYLSKFAQLIRITLDQSLREMVTMRETIDYLTRYIEMEKIRNEFIQYKFEVDNTIDIDDTIVSPMMIQPFVENSVWHGITSTKRDIFVRIVFEKQGKFLVCKVEDDGIGIWQGQFLKARSGIQRTSRGISNVQDRIALLNEKNKSECKVTVLDKQEIAPGNGSGTIVTIQIPFQTNHE